MLEDAILEEERDEYKKLIESSQKAANAAAQTLAEKTLSLERLKFELADASYTLGNIFFERQNYKTAIAAYEKTLFLNPADAWAHHNLGIIYDYYVQDKETALFHYQKYLKLKSPKEEADRIRERVLGMKLGSLVIPPMPLKEEYEKYEKQTDLRQTDFRVHT